MTPIPIIGQLSEAESQSWVNALTPRMPDVHFCPAAKLSKVQKQTVHYAVVANPSAQQLKEFPALDWVQSVWAGVEKLIDTFSETDISVTRLIDPNLSDAMAETALLWCLYLNRDMHRYAAFQQQQAWQPLPYRTPDQCTVGILGLGTLGTASAKRLSAHGFNILGWSRTAKPESCFPHRHGIDALPNVLANSDILLNLLPLTHATQHLLTQAQWQQCRPGMKFINFGRGATVHEADLLAALDSRLLEHAVLDVFDREPLPADHPYWQHPNISVLPHISAPTSIESAADITTENLRKKLAGAEVPTVDFQRGY